ncbi:MAG: hypothetical protein HQ567_01090 [Candidatus Nealsonbacteria bacterium]|nr:hypothetical protein [Candidatus Nealsonbacteria bacterium]
MKRLIALLSTVFVVASLFVVALLSGCGSDSQTAENSQVDKPPKPAEAPNDPSDATETSQEPPKAPPPSTITTEEQLKAALKEKNVNFSGQLETGIDGGQILAVRINDPAVEDISPLAGLPLTVLDLAGCHITNIDALKGMPLAVLYLAETGVSDLSPLKGMPLRQFHADHTPVADLSPLKGAPMLEELNLISSRVKDLKPLEGMPQLKMLWITGCPVSDVSPLANVRSLVSLTAAKTKIADLGPLKGHPLERLHIAESAVTDLTPVQWMRLTRLIFTPKRIEKGIEFARESKTIREIDVEFPAPRGGQPMGPAAFWSRYDAGAFK